MSLASALFLIAQAASPSAAALPVVERTAPVAEQVRASVTILRPARISLAEDGRTVALNAPANAHAVQRSRDAAGTLWIEFS